MWSMLRSLIEIYSEPREDWRLMDDGSDPAEAMIFVCLLAILLVV